MKRPADNRSYTVARGNLAEVEDFVEFLLQKDEDERLREAALKHPRRPLPSTTRVLRGLGSHDPSSWGRLG